LLSDKNQPQKPQKPRQSDDFGRLRAHEEVKQKASATSDRYTAFINTDPEDEEDDLAYWNARYTTQPDLARFALDMLSIPMMSAECERVFSSAKLLISDTRNRLSVDIIEANECLKAWYGRPKEETTDVDIRQELGKEIRGLGGIDVVYGKKDDSISAEVNSDQELPKEVLEEAQEEVEDEIRINDDQELSEPDEDWLSMDEDGEVFFKDVN